MKSAPTEMELEIAEMLMGGHSAEGVAETLRQPPDVVTGIKWEIHQDERYWTQRVKKLRGLPAPQLINCGECNLQKEYRVVLRDVCKRHGIKEGAPIEVFIRVVEL